MLPMQTYEMVKIKIEEVLGGHLASERPTQTI